MTTKPSYTPALRFPDFLNDGEWEVKRLGDCLIQPPDYGLNAPAVPFSDNMPTYLRITDISDDGCCIKEGKTSVDTVLTNENSLQDGDIVFARTGASVGKVYKYRKEDGPLVFAGFLIRIKPDNTKLDSDFLFQFLFSNTYKRWVEVTSTRSGQPGINSVDIASLPIPFPPLPEQRRIAQALTALDELIAATNEKLEQMKAYKKGLMQKLFPAKGKKLPELRFKEFEKDGEWELCSLETIFEIKNGYTPSKSNPKFWENGTLPWFRMEDIRLNGHILSDSIQHITPEAVKGSGLFPAYSIIVATTATIGEHALLIVDSLANQRFTFLTKRKSFDEKLDMMYFHYYMFIVDEWCKCNTNSGGLLSVNMPAFKKLRIPYPSNVDEQRKIADSFTSIDEMIKQYTNKATFLELYKKGLMQQMFPTSK